ncbi:MAG: TolB family protein [Bacteroidota bacterium]
MKQIGIILLLALLSAGCGEPLSTSCPRPSEVSLATQDLLTQRLTATPFPSARVSPTLNPPKGKLAFSSDREGNWEIYVMDLRDLGTANLTKYPGWDFLPLWRPSSNEVAFRSDRGGGIATECDNGEEVPRIRWYLMALDGTGVRELRWNGEQPAWMSLSWSPDGKRLAYGETFCTESANGFEVLFRIGVMDTEGRNGKVLTSGLFPCWSPTGEWIAFVRYPNGVHDRIPSDLFLIRPDGLGERLLFESPVPIHEFVWNPNGKEIAFAADGAIWIVDLEGMPRQLSKSAFHRCTAWSPDGEWLACERQGDIYAVRVDDALIMRLTDDPGEDSFPNWIP